MNKSVKKPYFLHEQEKGIYIESPPDKGKVVYGPASLPARILIAVFCDFWGKLATLCGYIVVPFVKARAVWMRPGVHGDYTERMDKDKEAR